MNCFHIMPAYGTRSCCLFSGDLSSYERGLQSSTRRVPCRNRMMVIEDVVPSIFFDSTSLNLLAPEAPAEPA